MVKPKVQNEKGFSSLEAVILMIVFTLMVSFTLGVFGIIHTGILHSIGARNYAFETFRHRTNLTYLRDAAHPGSGGLPDIVAFIDTNKPGENYRLHAVTSETSEKDSDRIQASERPITKAKELDAVQRNAQAHIKLNNSQELDNPGQRYGKNNEDGVNPAWIKVAYGICVTAACN